MKLRYLLFDKSLVCEFLPKEKVDTRTYLQSSLAFCACHRNFLETLLAVSQEALRRLAKNTEGQVKLVHSFLLNSPGVEHAYVHSSLWVFGSSLLLQDTRKERREKEVIQDNDRPMVEVSVNHEFKHFKHLQCWGPGCEVNGVSVPQLTEQQAPLTLRRCISLCIPAGDVPGRQAGSSDKSESSRIRHFWKGPSAQHPLV